MVKFAECLVFENITVETGEILIITKEWVSEQKIQIIILILKQGPYLTDPGKLSDIVLDNNPPAIGFAKAWWLDAKGDEDDGEKFLIKLPPVDIRESCNASQMNCNRARLRSTGNLFSWFERSQISKCVNQGQYLYIRRWITITVLSDF